MRCRPIIIRNRYTSMEKKAIEYAFGVIHKCPRSNRSRHVSLLVAGKQIIDYAVNNEKSSLPHKPLGFASIHSELGLVRKFLSNHYAGNLSQYEIFNVRINRFNEVVNSKPCRRCQYLLGNLFVPKKVRYTDESGDFVIWSNYG